MNGFGGFLRGRRESVCKWRRIFKTELSLNLLRGSVRKHLAFFSCSMPSLSKYTVSHRAVGTALYDAWCFLPKEIQVVWRTSLTQPAPIGGM